MSDIKLICIDSDGCAIDSMNIKHEVAFSKCLIDVFSLNHIEEKVRKIWYKYNLFSQTRGQNRFLTLSYTLHELAEQGEISLNLSPLDKWIKESSALSNASLLEICTDLDHSNILHLALEWSLAVNRTIASIPKEKVNPFDNVSKALSLIPKSVVVDIISSANSTAVASEWKRFGLLEYVTRLFSQDDGSKSECIKMCIASGISPNSIIMCGDSPGDLEAARKNSVFFFPILVGREGESWQMFIDEVIPHINDVNWINDNQDKYIEMFNKNLGAEN